ncbi:3-deoxy-manno-octulosonate-8-phosphatase KdsC [Candidatus Parabeggiatoa sp. HSG14]|uniref:3-deoxy-manno-octulosonate-8-phosphatase KdsC n=1 Tax=Candidatus Parabeggiatoa sp. HSG14 TaxID=3055593 RepID=UPI0025A706D1|nr:3-deoxy-manno-octulosonate-8-phosphatase KdsC [Thiotrichales bacterium HSG14]
MKTIFGKAKQIRLVVFDVDGVLTDGSLYLGEDGHEYKAFYAPDGLGMKLLQATGIIIGIISARTSQVVTHRMLSLGIEHVYQGKLDKLSAFKQLCDKLHIEPQQVAYVGDDLLDIPVMLHVGLAIAVANAHFLVIKNAHWQTQAAGGRGAAREVCELIMQAQGTFTAQLSHHGIAND